MGHNFAIAEKSLVESLPESAGDEAARLEPQTGDDLLLPDWRESNRNMLVMRARTGNNATLFARGYDASYVAASISKAYILAGGQPHLGSRDSAHDLRESNTRRIPASTPSSCPDRRKFEDAVVSYPQTLKVPPNTFPTTGQDPTLTRVPDVLAGYQCGTVYSRSICRSRGPRLGRYLRACVTPADALERSAFRSTRIQRF